MQRLRYDMSRILSSSPIFIWFVGLPGSGRTTHVNSLCEKLSLIEIPVVSLLIEESKRDTDRGKVLRDALKGKIERAPDELVVDLIKEALLLNPFARSSKGFIINNFPRTRKQAQLFVKEIKDVDAIIYLFADISTLLARLQAKSPENFESDLNKKKIVDYDREVKIATSGMRAKLEKDCKKFARERMGMAFNFSPLEAKNIKTKDTLFENCEVLGCPELGNSTTLLPNDMYDYYSAFGNMNTTTNATCIRSTGIFAVMHIKGNYTETISNCQNIGADLADVLSEIRTNQLASLINTTVGTWYKASYVGLDDIMNEGIFESSSGNFLHCTEYRAWGPGHPRSKRKSEDCVILDIDKTWKVVPCGVRLTGVCEFFPEAPTINELDFTYKCNKIQSKRKKKRCLVEKKTLRQLIEKSPRLDKCAMLGYEEHEIIN
ncbi:hypothetical protein HHI36_006403 [Cryptolaemus montrouzieri]|uniref:C-type lectin domain-containing protein n=1 Tax=Cryptolaemus montrouzieri TaxID=559131 RepID=A0ABD2NX96_9CUCU